MALIERFETQRIRLAIKLRDSGVDAPYEANWFQRHLGSSFTRFNHEDRYLT
jgi:hypothetical protein